MSMKFTTGSWEACERGDYADGGIVILGDDRRIAVVYQEDDATLIAAAPELYEALELVLDTYGFDSSTDSSIWQTVTAALAKARGEA